MTPQELIAKYKLSISTVFVPYSKSRNAGQWESLNWIVTLKKGDTEVASFDYFCGVSHCPASKWSDKYLKAVAIKIEIEEGRPARKGYGEKVFASNKPIIQPDIVDVLYSVVTDSDVLNCSSFEDWCETFGYDSDSIKAKCIYNDCLVFALKVRGCLGQAFLDDATIAFEDY